MRGSSQVGWRWSNSNHLELMRRGDDTWLFLLEWETTGDVALDGLPAVGDPHQASLDPHEIGLGSTEYLVCRFVTFSRNLEHPSFITEVPYVAKLC